MDTSINAPTWDSPYWSSTSGTTNGNSVEVIAYVWLLMNNEYFRNKTTCTVTKPPHNEPCSNVYKFMRGLCYTTYFDIRSPTQIVGHGQTINH